MPDGGSDVRRALAEAMIHGMGVDGECITCLLN